MLTSHTHLTVAYMDSVFHLYVGLLVHQVQSPCLLLAVVLFVYTLTCYVLTQYSAMKKTIWATGIFLVVSLAAVLM